MTPTPPSSNGHSPQDRSNDAYRVVRKRNRVPLSCGPCRNRKLKCNRQTPCENCVRRNDASSCSYATSAQPGRFRKRSAGSSASSSDEMQSRIDRLEGLVLSLMSGNTNNVSPRSSHDSQSMSSGGVGYGDSGDIDDDDDTMGTDEPEDNDRQDSQDAEDGVEEVRNALGFMKVHGGKSFYRGDTHWAALLSEISEVKKYFDETKQKHEIEMQKMRCEQQAAGYSKLEATGYPFSASRPPTRQQLLALIPKQELVDILVDTFFRYYDPIMHILHRPSFYKQYEEFWQDPNKADTIWIGLLLIMMSIAMKIHASTDGLPGDLLGRNADEMVQAFRMAAEQSLIVGEYSKKLYLHTVQTLIILLTTCTKDDCWLYLGMVVRIAMMMGMHRDPRHFPNISPAEGEIRRRLWTLISCMDVLVSIGIGLPSMIREDECDTSPPGNYHDDELVEGLTALPPQRDQEELTGVCYMRSKSAMSRAFWEVVRQVNSVKARPPYEQILKLEAEINKCYDEIPKYLRVKSVEDSVNDPGWVIIQRYNLDNLRQIAFLTLHRPYAARARENPRYVHSYRQCTEAAMRLLRHQDEQDRQWDTTLRHCRWYQDLQGVTEFLHAAIVVALELSCPYNATPSPGDREEKYKMLRRFCEIARGRKGDHDAEKAEKVISIMLEKIEREEPQVRERQRKLTEQQQQKTRWEHDMTRFASAPNRPPELAESPAPVQPSSDPLQSDQAAALTLGMMSGGGLTPNSALTPMFPVSTPGGTLSLPDIGPSPTETALEPSASVPSLDPRTGLLSPQMGPLSPPGWTPLWSSGNGPIGFDMPAGQDWDEWDEFMRGVDFDAPQLGGYPGIGMFSNPVQDKMEQQRGLDEK